MATNDDIPVERPFDMTSMETLETIIHDYSEPIETPLLMAELATVRRKAAAWDRYYELELAHVDRGHRPWLPGYVLEEIHGIANGTRGADHA